MDNRLIDVAIGLALVFALTSLLVTAVQEAWTQMRGNRGKILQRALASFVGDDAGFAKALMDHPLLVALSPQAQGQAVQRKPSYIEADSMVAALVSHLIQTHAGGVRPASPVALVDVVQSVATGALGTQAAQAGAVPAAALAGAAPARPNPLFARGLASLVIGVENDWPAFEKRLAAWYDAVNERASGWFKRDVQKTLFTIGFGTALVMNINPLVIGGRLWEDEALRAAVVKAAQAAVDERKATAAPVGADAAGGKTTIADAATAPAKPASATAPSSVKPAATVTSAAKPAAAAVSPLPALSAALQAALLEAAEALGGKDGRPPPALAPAADRLLELDRALRAPLPANEAARRVALTGLNDGAAALLAGIPAAAETAPLQAAGDQLRAAVAQRVAALQTPPDTATPPGPTEAPTAGGRIGNEKPAPTPSPSPEAKARFERCQQRFNEPQMIDVCRRAADLSALQAAGLPIGWTEAAWPTYTKTACSGQPFDAKGCALADRVVTPMEWGNLAVALAGWAITALACMLGAPFWFDLLGKLVKLRASGDRPSTAKGADSAGQPPGTQLARSPAGGGAGGAAGDAAGAGPAPMSDAVTDAERELTEAEVRRIQRALSMAEPECVGWFDGKTRAAIQTWQNKRGHPANGELSRAQVTELLALAQGDVADDYLA